MFTNPINGIQRAKRFTALKCRSWKKYLVFKPNKRQRRKWNQTYISIWLENVKHLGTCRAFKSIHIYILRKEKLCGKFSLKGWCIYIYLSLGSFIISEWLLYLPRHVYCVSASSTDCLCLSSRQHSSFD